ncbi:hypothetical protein [Flavobacterium polysaccharolyticum]|uniref:Anti-bacteriophage protein A/HamA C-terminal domain-containing protein n=1 Tax=Flavobacterium polysaccharolyticum TaxID=3133148 RepID=A0ABU9NIU8_9FLAO
MIGYKITEKIKIEEHITFIRISPTDIGLTLRNIFDSLSDLSWLNQFDEEYTIKDAFQVRTEATIKYISENIIKENDDSITQNSAEYIVSELARKSIVNELKYLDIPLAELIKIKDVGNHGFDFYSKNNNDVLIFGESKYLKGQNAYGKALKGIIEFVNRKQDSSDIIDIDKFCCKKSKENFTKGKKSFAAAFSSKKDKTENLIKNIKKNKEFIELKKYEELICVAVDI